MNGELKKKYIEGFYRRLMGKINPTQKYVAIDGKVYNTSPQGLKDFHGLRQANYGKCFKQGTFGEQLNLVHASYINQGNAGATKVIDFVKGFWIQGDTAVLYTPKLVIVQDIPEVENGRVVMYEKDLVSKLSKSPNKGVRFSDDGSILALKYGFKTELQNSEQMIRNPFPIALTGDLESSEKLADIQTKISKWGRIWAFDKGTQDEIRVPVLEESGRGLELHGNYFFDDGRGRYSFGVYK